MKKRVLSIAIIALQITITFAQNAKFQEAMGKALSSMASAKTPEDFKTNANTFARIANAEPMEWLPQFYAAQNRLFAGYALMESNMEEAQELAKTALTEIQAGEKIAPMETELMVLEAFTYQLQLIENPMANGQKFSPMIFKTLGKAEAINPNNPRIYAIRGQFTANMPEFYGGGLEKATPDIRKAAELFATFKPTSPLHPNWGQARNESVLKTIEEKNGKKG